MTPAIQLRFYEELNDYLPPEKRKRALAFAFEHGVTVAGLLGGMGVPVDKVDLILRNDASVGLSEILQDGDRISIYPVFESLDVTSVQRLREKPLRIPRFIAGRGLADLVRLLSDRGLDAIVGDAEPAALCRVAEKEGRILLVKGNPPPGVVLPSRVCRVVSSEALEQLGEILARLDLAR
jgi:hypothetical protein